MAGDDEVGPLDHILALAHEIIEECPNCAGKATKIAMWATEIRERRPGRPEVGRIVGFHTGGLVPDAKMRALVDQLTALMRYPE